MEAYFWIIRVLKQATSIQYIQEENHSEARQQNTSPPRRRNRPAHSIS